MRQLCACKGEWYTRKHQWYTTARKHLWYSDVYGIQKRVHCLKNERGISRSVSGMHSSARGTQIRKVEMILAQC